ncbi:hypothetical protein B1992_15005 [Pseudoxanthomonas broegbernensis]|uniref:Uncharacterized protein n=2 Tax=Pseudoxanthomonas broegbernensis TaxID=83619 RepID=A0A7V8GK17_9GAMM|nr:hypothetical protein B1992_15005 [Pseudoxanthomonas broegbernensis]MBB6066492.1 hypothetical protein [Pseudoxanthomonas broegbernensis]
MKDKVVLSILQELGWKCGKDEAGDVYCQLEQGGKQLQIIPTIRKLSDHFRVSLMPSISTKEFSAAAAQIFGEPIDHEPIIVSNLRDEKIPSVAREDVVRLAERALSWASMQDVEAGLAAYRSLPTDAKGARPLRHLAALALSGDVGRLHGYKESFDQGDRMGFVPYITAKMIERAISIAQENAEVSRPHCPRVISKP